MLEVRGCDARNVGASRGASGQGGLTCAVGHYSACRTRAWLQYLLTLQAWRWCTSVCTSALHLTCMPPCAFPPAVQEVANTVFSAFVLLELGVKLAAMGPLLYWRSNWHKLDVLLSLAATADIVTQVGRAAGYAGVSASWH